MHEKLLHMSHIFFAEIIHPLADCLLVESVDERKDVLLECLGRKKGCCFRLHDMHHLEPQLLPRQRSRKGGVPGGDRFRLDLAAFRIRAANKDVQVGMVAMFDDLGQLPLIFQIHSACGHSNEKLVDGVDHGMATFLQRGTQGPGGDPVHGSDHYELRGGIFHYSSLRL